MTNIGKRIKDRRKALGMSAEDVAAKMNVSPATIYRYESSDILNMGLDKLKPIADALKTSPAYLLDWDEELGKPSSSNVIPLPKTVRIPLVGKIACGEPITAVENIEDYLNIPIECGANFALRCQGDSMSGIRIIDGDIVLIRQQPDVEDGEIAAVLIDGEATLKRVYKMPGRITLRPENPAYQPIDIIGKNLDGVKILGKAIYFISEVK